MSYIQNTAPAGGSGTVTSVGLATGAGASDALYTISGSPVTTSGTLVETLKTQTANTVFAGATSGGAASPTFRALVAADLPAGTGTVTSVAMTGDGVIFNSTVTGSPITTSGTLVPALLTQTANTFLAGPTSGGAATPTFRAIGNADIPTGTVLWNQIGSASGALTLANTTFATTFNQTTPAIWTWANTTPTVPATSGLVLSAAANASGGNTQYTGTITGGGTNNYAGASVTVAGFVNGVNNGAFTVVSNTTTTITLNNASGTAETHAGTVSGTPSTTNNSPVLTLAGTSSTASATQTDSWTIQSTHAAGSADNPTINLSFLHAGSTGTKTVNLGAAGAQSVGISLFGSTSGGFNLTGSATGGNCNIANNAGGNVSFIGASGLILQGSGTAQVALATTVKLSPAGVNTFEVTSGTGVTTFRNVATTGSGVPAQYASTALTAQTAAITATTLYAVPAAGIGIYRISWAASITTAASVSSILGGANGFQVLYTSPTDSVVKTTVSGNSVTSAANTTGTATGGDIIVYAKASTNIQFQYDYTSSGTAMAYELHIKAEYLGN